MFTNILHDNLHANYHHHQSITLFEDGCVEVLMDFYGDVVLVNIGGVIFGILGLKVRKREILIYSCDSWLKMI